MKKRKAVFIYDVYELTLDIRAVIWSHIDEDSQQLARDVDKIVEDWFRLVLQKTNLYNTVPLHMNFLPIPIQQALITKHAEYQSWVYRVVRVPDEFVPEEVGVRLWQNDLYLLYNY